MLDGGQAGFPPSTPWVWAPPPGGAAAFCGWDGICVNTKWWPGDADGARAEPACGHEGPCLSGFLVCGHWAAGPRSRSLGGTSEGGKGRDR